MATVMGMRSDTEHKSKTWKIRKFTSSLSQLYTFFIVINTPFGNPHGNSNNSYYIKFYIHLVQRINSEEVVSFFLLSVLKWGKKDTSAKPEPCGKVKEIKTEIVPQKPII